MFGRCLSEQKLSNLICSHLSGQRNKHHEKDTIIKDLRNHGINTDVMNIEISLLPSLRIMEYSQFNRLHLIKKKYIQMM